MANAADIGSDCVILSGIMVPTLLWWIMEKPGRESASLQRCQTDHDNLHDREAGCVLEKELDPVGVNLMYLDAMGVSRCGSLFLLYASYP